MPHGLTLTESTSGARSLATSSMAVIGIIATASAVAGGATTALNAAFPIGAPVLVTNIADAIGKAGTGGTLLPTLKAIADQVSPVLVVLRVEEGEDDAETSANVIAAIPALISAKSAVGVRPRIIGAPGLDAATVTAQLVIAAKRLRGRAYARAIGDDDAAVIAYRNTFSARELTLIWPNTSPTFVGDATARALGLRARIDETTGWHKTISNVAMDGVTALTRNIAFDLLDPSTEAGVLNDADVVTFIGKRRKLRAIPLTAKALKIIETQPRYIGCDWVFYRMDEDAEGNPVAVRYSNLASNFGAYTLRAEKRAIKAKRPYRRFRFHDLRHLYAVEYLRHGKGGIYDLQKVLGHTSVKTTEVYLDYLTPEEARAAQTGVSQKGAHVQRS